MKPTELDCLLQSLGIIPHYLGYCYLKEAVLMAAEDSDRIRHIRRQIYLPIAVRHQVSLESVEKNLRTVIRGMHGRASPLYLKVMGLDSLDRPPDNGTFLRRTAAALAEKSTER